jgi:hypothetical protein
LSERTRLGLGILGAAAALGILGDLLLRATPWGLNWAIWATALVAVAAALGARRRWALGIALLFSAGLLWRAAPPLVALNLLAAAGAAALATIPALRAGVLAHLLATLRLAGDAAAGPVQVAVDDVRWDEVPRRLGKRWGAVGRGVAIAAPLVFLFGVLFAAADAVFADIVADVFDFGDPLVHVTVFVLWAWVSAGVLHHLLSEHGLVDPKPERRLGTTEVAIVLGALDVLFLGFVLVQLRYLFGGDDHVVETTGLTYAEYARRGFFELLFVTALALPLVLVGDALARPRRLFRALSLLLVALLGVVVVSALERMRLYTDAYGLTQLRLYATALMLTLAAVFAWAAVTVLRERRGTFAVGSVAIAFATVATLNVVNPDALIARVNIDRHVHDGKPLDTFYLGGLSTDATPTIFARLDELSRVQARSLMVFADRGGGDWRTWSWSRARAATYDSSDVAANR